MKMQDIRQYCLITGGGRYHMLQGEDGLFNFKATYLNKNIFVYVQEDDGEDDASIDGSDEHYLNYPVLKTLQRFNKRRV